MTDLIQISFSDIEAHQKCARRFYYEQRMRMGALPAARSSANNIGTLMHSLLEGATEGGIDPESARALFDRERLAEGERERILKACQTIQDSDDYAEVMAGAGIRCERPFFLALPDHPTRFLKGFIDIQSTREDGSLLILDYKSGTREASARDYEEQARCYALVGLADGHPEVEVRFIRPEVLAGGAPQVFSLGPFSQQDRADIETALVATIHKMQEAGPDANTADSAAHPWACEGCLIDPVACPRGR